MMGYYNSNNKKAGKRGYFASSFTGLIAGALLVGVILPGVTDTEPETLTSGGAASTNESVSGLQTASTVVTSDVTEVVEQTNGAVVGVSNLQAAQQNPFSSPAGTDSDAQEAGAGSGVIYKKDGDIAY